jgi:hypothetical protein
MQFMVMVRLLLTVFSSLFFGIFTVFICVVQPWHFLNEKMYEFKGSQLLQCACFVRLVA